MSEIKPMGAGIMDKIHRDVNAEFIRFDEDFDATRDAREVIIEKVMEAVKGTSLMNGKGILAADSSDTLEVMKVALSALKDKEKANVQAASTKLRQKEQEQATAEMAAERLQVVIQATLPGRITKEVSSEDLDAKLAQMFDGKINDFELRQNPNDISD